MKQSVSLKVICCKQEYGGNFYTPFIWDSYPFNDKDKGGYIKTSGKPLNINK